MLKRENYNDIFAFLKVAQEKNFNKASQKLGISSPALSKKIHQLEQRLGVQLFNRTTRSLSLTQVGEQLFRTVETSFAKMDNELQLIEHYRNSPSGLVRINCGLQVIETLLLPKLAHFKDKYPDIQFEFISDNRFVDIVAKGFDAGIRFGSDVAEDMVAVCISQPMKMAVVATADYFQKKGFPSTIQELTQHQCIGYRLSNGHLFQWQFEYSGQIVKITPQGQWILNDDYPTLIAAKMGLGIAYLPEELIAKELANGQLIRIFNEYSYTFPPLYLYYPHRNISSALRVVVNTLRV